MINLHYPCVYFHITGRKAVDSLLQMGDLRHQPCITDGPPQLQHKPTARQHQGRVVVQTLQDVHYNGETYGETYLHSSG